MLTSLTPFAVGPVLDPASPARVTRLTSRYHLHLLPAPPPECSLRPTALNDAGTILGNHVCPARFEGAAWIATGVAFPAPRSIPAAASGPVEPAAVAAESSWPYQALSADGLIVGTRGTPASARRAWASHLGDFGEDWWPGAVSIAQAVNRQGVVVGKTFLPAEPFLIFRAFIIGETGRPRFLTPPDGGMTDAIAINERGTVLLNATALAARGAHQHAWLWHEQTFTALETPPDCSSIATALTADDAVAGLVRTEGGLSCAALWRDGRLVDLGTPLAADFRPAAARDADLIVGSALTPTGRRAACRWTRAGGLEFLSALTAFGQPTYSGPPLTAAVDVNRHGHILALAETGRRTTGVWLEPAT